MTDAVARAAWRRQVLGVQALEMRKKAMAAAQKG